MLKDDLKVTARDRKRVRREMDALEAILVALTPLDFRAETVAPLGV